MEFYHITNRGVDGRSIVIDTQDYARFVHDLYEFNDTLPAQEYIRRANTDMGRTTSHVRKCIVDIHAWCLMKNHYHLLVSERVEGGITLFLRKLSGYGRYFNERHKRSGMLLQKSKKILINNEVHFNYILHYIHLNPLDYAREFKNWRIRDENTISNAQKALCHLDQYRWSSFSDYCGIKNFSSIINKSFFNEVFPDYRASIFKYLCSLSQTQQQDYKNLTLE